MGCLAGVGADHWSADAFRARYDMPVSGLSGNETDDLSAFSDL